ncbi:MAG: biotin--[Lachnospiraceae bacterium]|nr:biotin--[acetyl-CoA-carboxylase] ligase [Lachnospiraceae bacterium]
ECARQFEDCYGVFERDRDLRNLKDEYNSNCTNNGNRVKVLDPKGEYLGVSEGITDSGRLIVRLPDGSISEVDSGEVSVRGIYGYV